MTHDHQRFVGVQLLLSLDLQRHGPDAELTAGANDPEGRLSLVRSKNLLELGFLAKKSKKGI